MHNSCMAFHTNPSTTLETIMLKSLSAVCFCALLSVFMLPAPAAAQGGGWSPTLGHWSCPDNGSTTPINPATSMTYRIWNHGLDNTITVTVKDSQGHQVGDVHNLPNGTSVDVAVPAGGSATIADDDDADTNGATGDYDVV